MFFCRTKDQTRFASISTEECGFAARRCSCRTFCTLWDSLAAKSKCYSFFRSERNVYTIGIFLSRIWWGRTQIDWCILDHSIVGIFISPGIIELRLVVISRGSFGIRPTNIIHGAGYRLTSLLFRLPWFLKMWLFGFWAGLWCCRALLGWLLRRSHDRRDYRYQEMHIFVTTFEK